MALLNLPLAGRKERERMGPHRRLVEAGVHHHRRQPRGRQCLLDAGRRQRIDERCRVADQQPAITGILARSIRRRIVAPTVRHRTMHRPAIARTAASWRSRHGTHRAMSTPRAQIGSLRIDHRADVPHAAARRAPTTSIRRRMTRRSCACRRAPATRGRCAIRRPARWCAALRHNSRTPFSFAITPVRPVQSSTNGRSAARTRHRGTARRSTATPARTPRGAASTSSAPSSTCQPRAPPANRLHTRRHALPHHTVLPVERMNPACSIASATPMASNSFAQLGGRDTARRWSARGRVISRTRWPHDARASRAAAAPAGPPPSTTTAGGRRHSARLISRRRRTRSVMTRPARFTCTKIRYAPGSGNPYGNDTVDGRRRLVLRVFGARGHRDVHRRHRR